MEKFRQLIVSVVGHVDHGKSSVLDKIRGSCIVDGEAGKITQAIGASMVPINKISDVCGGLLNKEQMQMPGLLFIDTPGHAAFTSLRKRGGSLADMAVLIVDINEGFKPQTIEAMEILKQFKTPFVVAANKSDLLPGWNSATEKCGVLKNQSAAALSILDTKIYELVGKIFEIGFTADRYDRVEDFAKNIAIVPVSAKTGQGLPELLMVLVGLAQKFLGDKLKTEATKIAQGTILEVKEVKGLGLVADTILYKGTLNRNDTLLVGGMTGVIKSKVKALWVPSVLCEIRDKKAGFKNENSVESAAVVRVVAPDIAGVVAGMPLIAVSNSIKDTTEYEEKIKAEIEEVILDVGGKGIVIKADSLGSLEALIKMLKDKGIQIKKASIGNISKRDISEAGSNLETDEMTGVLLGFNITVNRDAQEQIEKSSVKVITSEVIYHIIEQYEKWHKEKLTELQRKELKMLVSPAKVLMLKGYIFRESNPAVFGVEVLAGLLKNDSPVMNAQGKRLSQVKSIQENQDNLDQAERGRQVALSMYKVIIGRQLNEGDTLYSDVPEEDFRKFKGLKQLLSQEQKNLLKELAVIKRKDNPFWGV